MIFVQEVTEINNNEPQNEKTRGTHEREDGY